MSKDPTWIALLGAPGAGKTELAKALAEKLDGKVKIVDDYVAQLEDRADVRLGYMANYLGNVMVGCERVGMERAALSEDPDYIITCGTMIDTIVYAAIEANLHNSSDDEQKAHHQNRMNVNMTYLGMFMADTWGYTSAFFLPLSEEAKTAEDNDLSEWDAAIDREILLALGSFTEVSSITLPAEDKDARVDKALEVILERKNSDAVEVSDGPRSEPSGEAGEAVGHTD